MSHEQFDIIFRGDIVFGHQLADVKLRLQQLFKADAAKIDALFSGRPVPLKRGLDLASAQKYKEALIKAGAQVDVVPMGATRPASTTTPANPPLTLAQRLANQEADEKRAAEAAATRAALQEQTAQNPATNNQSGWSLAPVGSDLLQAAEKKIQEPRDIDTSAISLRPEGGNILDANERASASVAAVITPDFEVAEVGADLIAADEKMDLPLLEIELEDWSLADLGDDLIAPSEKPFVDVPVIHVPDVGLAPVGTDLGQIKPNLKPVVPDISGIRLAD